MEPLFGYIKILIIILFFESGALDQFFDYIFEYLNKRKIDFKDFYVCLNGNYNNRIIIPYFNEMKELIYFNSRALHETKLRYLGPPKTIGVGKEDILYFPSIPTAIITNCLVNF